MERINICEKTKNEIALIDANGSYILDGKSICSLKTINVKSQVKCNLLLGNVDCDCDFDIVVEEGATLDAKGIFTGDSINVNFHTKNSKNSSISLHFIDFSTGKSVILANADMNETGAEYDWNMASLASNNDNKIIKINVEHNNQYLIGNVSNYGVCKDEAKLEIAGTTHISKGSKNTITKQNARIMLIDEYSRGISKPILKIDENDVKANHGASLGQLNEEHLFYLRSRGLSEAEAKKLIILGYFNPIMLLFKGEELEEYISKLIGERV